MSHGLLLVVEGPDGVGKSTVISGVANHFQTLDIRHSVFSFPGREQGTLGKLVYDVHHCPKLFDIEEMSATANQALHLAAHLDAIERRIGPLLPDGEHVLLDRFWWSTWVYGVVGGASIEVLKALIEAERIHWGCLQPSLVVLIDRDEPINRADDMNVWGRIRSEYLALATKENAFYPVQVVRNTSAVENTVKCLLDLALPLTFDTRADAPPG